MTVVYLLLGGLVVHLVFLSSIFDIYFKSPIITSIGPVKNDGVPASKRVVLVSVDGLRADALFDQDSIGSGRIAQFLEEVMKYRGSWGLSQSRVPTESRPGHVAMLAGFYEDPSAVTKGWKENPVDFDSIFNRSRCSFAWGSPDILNIFFKGLRHNCAFAESYAHEQEFAGDTKLYDNWVFEKLTQFMNKSSTNSSVLSTLHQQGIFFFLHLLGQDTSGHTDKPHSDNYKENFKNVDHLLRKIDHLFYQFYRDANTTFIVTSDHGMTDWGSHGAGDAEETNTPIVAWGAGIKKPSDPPRGLIISQADITPLLSVLLGVPIPVNSLGTLPTEFLNMSTKQIAEATELNARQMVAQFVKALKDKEEQIMPWLHSPFRNLSTQIASKHFSSIREAILKGKYSEAITQSQQLIQTALEGLKYYQNYYQRCLLISISLAYMGWITYLVLMLLQDQKQSFPNPMSKFLGMVLSLSALVTLILVSSQNLPWSFYFYLLLPQVLWYMAFQKVCSLSGPMHTLYKTHFVRLLLLILLAVEILVMSFFRRWLLCVSVAVVLCWSFFEKEGKRLGWSRAIWLVSGAALAIFPLLPTIGSRPRPWVAAGSGTVLCLLALAAAFGLPTAYRRLTFGFSLRFLSLALAVFNSYYIHKGFNESHGVADLNRYLSWCLLVGSCCCCFSRPGYGLFKRLFDVFLALSVPFVLLSITHEAFFLAILFLHLFCWIIVEDSMKKGYSTSSLFRISYSFLTYIFLSFFGLGNVSSLNSFDPAWVRCFLTVFSPFLMSSLILFKTAIPFLIVSCTLRAATLFLKLNPGKIFLIVLIYCNIMALNFLFLVKNEGSWLDIGVSISHYVIQQVTIVFLLLLFALANRLIASPGNLPPSSSKQGRSQEEPLPLFYAYSSKQHTY